MHQHFVLTKGVHPRHPKFLGSREISGDFWRSDRGEGLPQIAGIAVTAEIAGIGNRKESFAADLRWRNARFC